MTRLGYHKSLNSMIQNSSLPLINRRMYPHLERKSSIYLLRFVLLLLLVFSSSIYATNEQHEEADPYVMDPVIGIEQSTRAYAFAMDQRDNEAAASALIRMGKFYFLQGDYNLAEDMFSKALSLYIKLKNGQGVAQALIGQGDVFRKEKKYAQALSHFRAAEKLASEWEFEVELCLVNNRIGDIYRHQRNYDQAEHYYERSIYLARKQGNVIELANNYTNLAEIKRLNNKLAIARDYYEKALLIAREVDNRFGIVENQHGLACIDTSQGKRDQAMARLKEARSIAEKRHYREELKNVYAIEASMYEKNGDLLMSLQIQKEFNELNERLYLSSVTLQNTQQRTINEIEQKNRELFEKSSTISMMSRMQVGLFIAVVLLLIAAGFLYYLNTQHSIDSKEIAKQTTQLKEQEEQSEKHRLLLEQANDNSTRLLKLLKSDIRKPIDDTIRNLETLMHQTDSAQRLYETCASVVADLQLTNQLIDNLLFWSSKTTHRIQAGFEIVNLRNCLSDEMYLLSALAKAKSIELINELPESQVVYADPQLIQMSIRNLVLNEIKNAAMGAVIKVDAHRVNGHVEVRVNHSGKTLSPDAIASLFDEKQLYRQQPEVGQIASGLSLLLSRDVIQKNRGYIRVTSEATLGTTYHFTLQSV